MWLAHYSFHFLGSFDAATPAVGRFAADMGLTAMSQTAESCACCRPIADWLPRLEIVFLDLGFLLSLYSAYRIACMQASQSASVWKAMVPWACLIVVLFAVGVWIVLQPMQMRGTLVGVG